MKRALLQRESENWRIMHRNRVLRSIENCSCSLKIEMYASSEWQVPDRDYKYRMVSKSSTESGDLCKSVERSHTVVEDFVEDRITVENASRKCTEISKANRLSERFLLYRLTVLQLRMFEMVENSSSECKSWIRNFQIKSTEWNS